MKKLFAVTHHSAFTDISLLLLRLVIGFAFTQHGWSKIQNPFAWMPAEAGVPGFLQGLAALSEFGGGIAWIIGLLTPLASLGILCTMAVAFSFHTFQQGDPFVAGPGQAASSELAAVYFCIAFLILAMGPGRFSIDRGIFGGKRVDNSHE